MTALQPLLDSAIFPDALQVRGALMGLVLARSGHPSVKRCEQQAIGVYNG